MQNFTELYEVERRYEELAHRMSTPDAAANADEYARMMRDYKELTPLIEEYRRYTDLQQQEADAKEMLAAESDPAFAGAVRNWPESGTERRESASAAHPEGRR